MVFAVRLDRLPGEASCLLVVGLLVRIAALICVKVLGWLRL